MKLLRTKFLYQEACRNSPDVHEITERERIELQHRLLSIYREIEAVCIRHNLTVMLAYGSVLGAIRHGGFIPWDDDMDLFMPRRDYELMINQYADELPDFLKVYAPNSRNKAITRFAKVVDTRTKFIEAESDDLDDPSQGVFVDIFPLDSIGVNSFLNAVNRYISMFLMYMGSSVGYYEKNSVNYRKLMAYSFTTRFNYWFRYCLGFFGSFISFQTWMNIIDKFCKKNNRTGFLDELVGVYKWHPLPESIFLPPVRGKFEGINVFLPHDAKRHLEHSYHDWQRIPRKEERGQHFINCIKINPENGVSITKD